jgi:hypothetical protein
MVSSVWPDAVIALEHHAIVHVPIGTALFSRLLAAPTASRPTPWNTFDPTLLTRLAATELIVDLAELRREIVRALERTRRASLSTRKRPMDEEGDEARKRSEMSVEPREGGD